MIKKIGFAIVCLACFGTYAQDGTVSPYSYFGIGEMRSATTVENQMMGGIGIYTDSIHVNLQNPSAYGRMGLRFGETYGITTYTAGISYNQISLKSTTLEERSSITNLDYVSLAFMLRKNFGVGFGIMPLSSVGYNIESMTTTSATDTNTIRNQYTGSGGLNRVYGSVGWAITESLRIGVTGNYNFGTLESERLQIVENVQLATFDNRSSRINGMDFNYAINYTPRFKDKYRLHTSVRVNTQANLSTRNTQRIGSLVADDRSTVFGAELEGIDVDLNRIGREETALKIPTKTTLGLGIGEDTTWFLGGEYSFQGLSSFSSPLFEFNNVVYQDASTIALGGFWVPDHTSFKFLKRITYRAGVRMEKTGMLVNNTEIDNFGITFGVGLPLSRSFSNLNLGFELGRRGTTDALLIEENYVKINIGLSLNDQWFRKAKIN